MHYNFVLPGWGYLLVAGAIYLFYATNRSKNMRRGHRRERLKEKQEELLAMLKERDKIKDVDEPEKK